MKASNDRIVVSSEYYNEIVVLSDYSEQMRGWVESTVELRERAQCAWYCEAQEVLYVGESTGVEMVDMVDMRVIRSVKTQEQVEVIMPLGERYIVLGEHQGYL